MNDGNWHALVVVRNSKNLSIYIDGNLDNTGKSATGIANINNDNVFKPGRSCVNKGLFTPNAVYRNLRVYENRALTGDDAEKMWDTLGGSMWEIQHILDQLFAKPIDDALTLYKQKMTGIIAYYTGLNPHKRAILKRFINNRSQDLDDLADLEMEYEALEEFLKDMVRNNILYFDPTSAVYYPQSRSYQWGIRLYFESLKRKARGKKEKKSG